MRVILSFVIALVVPAAAAMAFDAPARPTVRRFALLPADVRHPESLAADAGRRVLHVGTFDARVPEATRNNRILRYGFDGRLQASRTMGTSPLTGVASHGGHVYVLDFAKAALIRLAADFDADTPIETVATFPVLSSPPGEREVDNPDGSKDRIRFGTNRVAALNGLVFSRGGDAYVTDSFQGALFVVRGAAVCTACKAELVLQHPLLATAAFLPFGANGVAFGDDGTLFINNAGDGRVLRLTLATKQLEVFAEGLPGADGLLFHDGLLWVAANQVDAVVALDTAGKPVVRVEGFAGIDADGAPAGLLFPAATAVVGDRMVVANLALPLTPTPGDEWEESVTRWSLVAFDLPRAARRGVTPSPRAGTAPSRKDRP
ncbi:hypothetical protein ACQQ2N_01775 [Dokdonella sp. MW10]|uniref:hypothetical protein n=1 Tax=Dokdonella sp. MW10 TaxID=2992926 RepID=UPI003F7FA4F2